MRSCTCTCSRLDSIILDCPGYVGRQRSPVLQTETDEPMAATVTAKYGLSPTVLALMQIQDHVEEAMAMMNRVTNPSAALERMIEDIDARLRICFERLRDPRPNDDDETTERDILRYAGERRMLEVNGYNDINRKYEERIAGIRQMLSDQLIAAIGPIGVRRSVQNIAAQNPEWYPLGSLFAGTDVTAASEADRESDGRQSNRDVQLTPS